MQVTRRAAASAVLAVVLAGCGGDAAATSTVAAATSTATADTAGPPGPAGTLWGFSLSPRSYDEAGLGEFAATAAAGDFVERVGDIVEWEQPAGGALGAVQTMAANRGLAAISVAGIFETADAAPIRPLDDATLDRYVAAARAYAAAVHPAYLGLGVEIDTQWRTHPDDFEVFVDLFAAVAEAVHEVSPGTAVFTTFQLEQLSGMQGGIFGGENDPAQAAWDLIGRFPAADLIGFTTYPGLAFSDPADLPDDYYAAAASHAGGRPIAFTEIGWQAAGDLGPYSGSDRKQADFAGRFGELIDGVDVSFVCWSFLYDQSAAPEPFASMGLFRADGSARPAWPVWLDNA